MADFEEDELLVLSDTHSKLSNEPVNSKFQRPVPRTRSMSISIPMISMEPYERATNLVVVGLTGPLWCERKTPFNQMSGPLYVTHRPGNLFRQNVLAQGKQAVESKTEKFPSFNSMGENDLQNNYAGKNEHLLRSGQLGMCNDPYCTTCPTYFKATEQRNSKASGIFDPKDHKCIAINLTMTTMLVLLRSMNDFIYFLNIILQFRLAYVAPESRVVGAGELVDIPKKIALHYLQTYFVIDLFDVLPLPQMIISFVLPKYLGLSRANYAKNLLRVVGLVQYIPRLCRFLPMLISPTGFIFESAWANFFISLLTFMLSGHVVGSCWYLFRLQRVNQCLRNACSTTHIDECTKFIDCGHGNAEQYQTNPNWVHWKNNTYTNACFTEAN